MTQLSSTKLCKITSGRFECVEPTKGAKKGGGLVHSRGENQIKDGGGRDLKCSAERWLPPSNLTARRRGAEAWARMPAAEDTALAANR